MTGGLYAMAGNRVFTLDPYARLFSYDLQSGVSSYLLASGDVTALGADDTSIWVVARQKLQKFSFTGTLISERSLPYKVTGSMLAVGDNLYATDESTTSIVQLHKDQPVYTAVAGDTALDGLLLNTVTGIASDGNRLYAADTHGLNTVTKAVRTYAAVPEEPKVTAAVASNTTALGSTTTGAATVGNLTYTGRGNQVVRTDTRAGTTTVFAGTGNAGCTDAAQGSDASFTNPIVIGADDNLVYIADCGIRTIHVGNGATRRLPNAPSGTRYTMASHTIFISDAWAQLYQYDLQTGSTTYLASTGSVSAMAADDQGAWIASGQNLTRYASGSGTATTVSTQMPALLDGLMTSVGGYLYAKVVHAAGNLPDQATLSSISKIDGSVFEVATGDTDGSPFNPLNGIASALTFNKGELIAVVTETDADGITKTLLRRIGILGYKVDPDLYISPNTIFVPTNNTLRNELIGNGPRLFWNPETELCDYGTYDCSGIYAWRQAEFEAEGGDSFFHKVKCQFLGCMPEDLETELLKQLVGEQGIYYFAGLMRTDFKRELTEEICAAEALDPDSTCDEVDLAAIADGATELASIVTGLSSYVLAKGKIRGPLKAEHQAALTRLQQLANQACRSTALVWNRNMFGQEAHKVFDTLVKNERAQNPKFWGETGYSLGQVVPKGYNKQHNLPDFVYGTSQATPEFIADFKTGRTGIRGSWYKKLVHNLPTGYKNVPVFKVTC